ncbi:MAG: RICIN domain-containing protein [Lachnospiraceae bacterium]|nr:RICIN domain-containing protein [Lachnospiraceae bacterium]
MKLWNVKTRPEERWVIVACGICMDIQGGSTVNGADVQVYPYEGTADQKWKIQKT